MTGAAALCATAMMFFAGPLFAEEGTPSDGDKGGFRAVPIISKNCSERTPASGPGSAAEPITASLWELDGAKRYDCKWVRTEAVLTWTDYWHYRANAHSDFEDLLFTNWDDHSFLIEDFADASVSMRDFHRATVRLTAVYAELCDEETIGGDDNVWIYGGPCHYRPVGLLQHARIDKVLSPPFRRLTGEDNRRILARLWRAPTDWPESPRLRKAVLDWIAAAQTGPDHFREFMYGPSEKLDENGREFVFDPNAWHNFVGGPDSPLLKLRKPPQNWTVEYFYSFDEPPESWSSVEDVTACVCLVGDCEDRWPLLPGDTDYMWGDYICADVDKHDGVWSIGHTQASN